ncbi:hypothetical protein ACHAXR_010297 [Thalassiosira sp. AJA248-18]
MCLAIPNNTLFVRRLLTRRRQKMLMAAAVLHMLEDEDDHKPLRGRMMGSKNIRRTRKEVENMWNELGGYARKAWRMSLDSFKSLHAKLEARLRDEFHAGDRTAGGKTPNGDIPTKLRLSAAIRFFAGAAVYDIMLTHGMGRQTVYQSVYGVVNVVNAEPSLSFNDNGAEFPSHEEQKEIAAGFELKSGAGFDKIVLAVDGMLVWTIQPSMADCEYLKIGQRLFHCYRKDKFGWLLMAGCDDQTRFRWADIRHPSSTSDYLAWTTSTVGRELENEDSDLVLGGHSIAGDNAFVESMSMSTPVPGIHISDVEDGYNFYLSQLRITIERAFGILVHRWGVLRRPLSMSILKVPAIVTCLMRLHNFCIDVDSRRTPSPLVDDERNIRRVASRRIRRRRVSSSKRKRKRTYRKSAPSAVALDDRGTPSSLLGSGHHFQDEPRGTGRRPHSPRDLRTPMRIMMQQVADLDLRRPALN